MFKQTTNIKKTLIIVFAFSILAANSLFAISPVFADDGGVFEGVSSCMKSGNCSLCGFLSIFVNIGRWILSVMGGIALVYFVWAGIGLIMSFGNSEKVANARKSIIGSILGIGIILGAWTLVNFIFVGFIANSTDGIANIWNGQAPWSTVGGMCVNLEPTVVSMPVINISTTTNEAQLKAALESYGVTTNNPPCSIERISKCTNLAGMQPETVSEIINLANQIGSENVVVTGGTEPGHSTGDYSHANGYKVDLGLNSAVQQYVLSNKTKGPYHRSDGAKAYMVGNIEYALESDHWDVCVKCKS